MTPKVSVILPTNRINDKVFIKIKEIQDAIASGRYKNRKILNNEFIELLDSRTTGINHYLQLTLKSLENQTFKDFEVIISHRYPEDALNIVKECNLNIKLVKEKPSLWHTLGDKYGTLCNNINTAVIQSSGELLWRLDDLTFFNDNLLKEIWNLWTGSYYITSPSYRCIEFDEKANYQGPKVTKLGPGKDRIEHAGIRAERKTLGDNDPTVYTPIPKYMSWGCSSTVSIKDFLEVNGQDEIYDGSISGTDMDLGVRLSRISNHDRLISKNFVYEINDIPYKYMMRDDVMMRRIFGVSHIKGNTWKPLPKDLRRYEEWHKQFIGDLDPNWNKFMDIPQIDMVEEYNLKRLGEVIYSHA